MTNIRMISKIISSAESEKETLSLLKLLLTEKEQEELANRIKILQLLLRKAPQREISKKLGVGISTVSRGAQVMHLDQKGVLKKHLL